MSADEAIRVLMSDYPNNIPSGSEDENLSDGDVNDFSFENDQMNTDEDDSSKMSDSDNDDRSEPAAKQP